MFSVCSFFPLAAENMVAKVFVKCLLSVWDRGGQSDFTHNARRLGKKKMKCCLKEDVYD